MTVVVAEMMVEVTAQAGSRLIVRALQVLLLVVVEAVRLMLAVRLKPVAQALPAWS